MDTEVKEKYPEVFDYILQEETDFRTRKIPLGSNWEWNMFSHIDKSFMMKNSQYMFGDNESMKRPVKNIILPIANVNYRSEGFDVKNIELYVDNADKYNLSAISRKFHNRWALKYSIDTAIDDSVASYYDYGLILVKNENDKRPVIIDLKKELAFCNQTDVLSGAICLKHTYSIDELQDMDNKWDSKELERAIRMASKSSQDANGREIRVNTKGLEIYELHGVFPESWLGKEKLGDEWEDKGKYVRQLHVITYYVDQNEDKKGITLYKGKISNKFKALKRDKISGRACGRGGIEELFHPQTWTNYSEIHLQQMLEATSKVITKTNDKKLAQNNDLGKVKHNQIIYLEDGKTWEQMPIQPLNKVAFDNYVNTWEQNARIIGSASDPALGLNPVSGTPLGTTQIVTQEGHGIHEYRRGQIATFWGEIYRDWVLQYIVDDINKGDEWLDEFSIDELKEIAKSISTKYANQKIKDIYLSGKTIDETERDALVETIKESFLQGGKQRFIKLMKDDFKDIPLSVKFNIANKQKNLYEVVSKLNGVFQTIFRNPQVLEQPGMAELFNSIIEQSGLDPFNFSAFTSKDKKIVSPIASPVNLQSVSPPISQGVDNNLANNQ